MGFEITRSSKIPDNQNNVSARVGVFILQMLENSNSLKFLRAYALFENCRILADPVSFCTFLSRSCRLAHRFLHVPKLPPSCAVRNTFTQFRCFRTRSRGNLLARRKLCCQVALIADNTHTHTPLGSREIRGPGISTA